MSDGRIKTKYERAIEEFKQLIEDGVDELEAYEIIQNKYGIILV